MYTLFHPEGEGGGGGGGGGGVVNTNWHFLL